ncbi:MAG: hypothetical protein J2O38_07020 [Acidimicrobiales bacterium]|nr:hypothetical protein [Acidimicrobiales bacterium]
MALGDGPHEVSIDFSAEELAYLLEVRGHARLPLLDDEPSSHHGPEVRAAVRAATQRSLMARRILSPPGQSGEESDGLQAAVAQLLSLVAGPGLVAEIAREDAEAARRWYLAALPEVSVEHAALPGGIHRLTPFPTADFLVRVASLAGLAGPATDPDRPGGRHRFSVSGSAFRRAGEAVAGGDRQAAVRALTGAGVGSEAAEAFTSALAEKDATAAVTILYRPEPDLVEGGELAFLDAGGRGLWTLPLPDAEAEAVGHDPVASVSEVTPAELTAQLAGFLPAAGVPEPR